MSNDTTNKDNNKEDNGITYEGIAQSDMPAILEAIDIVMKYTKREGDTMAVRDTEYYIDALLKFNIFTFIALSKLIDYHTKTVSPESTTTKTDNISEIMKRYSSFYS
jgi:hypothetical protein